MLSGIMLIVVMPSVVASKIEALIVKLKRTEMTVPMAP